MKWFHFWADGGLRLGAMTSRGPVDATGSHALPGRELPDVTAVMRLRGEERARLENTLEIGRLPLLAAPLHYAPAVPRPGKILCVGLNYPSHNAEMPFTAPEAPTMFSKCLNTLAAHEEAIPFPGEGFRLDYEAELVAVVGRTGRRIPRGEAGAYIFGYTVGNDLSERVTQMQSSQWLLGKSWDRFAPVGPFLVTADALDLSDTAIVCRVNGEERQRANTRQMIFSPEDVVSFVSRSMTLEPGDLIFTGTPGGVMQGYPPEKQRWLQPGDVVEVEIQNIGVLRSPIV